jgi:dTDP-4-dehydrorhamnose 3,5-epimerase
MEVHNTELPEVLVVEPKVFPDQRGFFLETFNEPRYRDAGIAGPFVQDNMTWTRKGVLRGMHYQLKYPQGKLVAAIHGEIFDVAVDIRRGSPTFGKWVGVTLNDENRRQIWVPPGFAHGYCVLSDYAYVTYKCSDVYHPEDDYHLSWNDPAIAIDWPVAEPVLSEKDRVNRTLADLDAGDLLPRYAASA